MVDDAANLLIIISFLSGKCLKSFVQMPAFIIAIIYFLEEWNMISWKWFTFLIDLQSHKFIDILDQLHSLALCSRGYC